MTTNRERRLSQTKQCLGAWIMAFLALFPATLSAAQSVTASAGGTGGNPYTIGCGTNAMVGVRGAEHAPVPIGVTVTNLIVVGFIQPICVGLNADGSWNGTPAPAQGIAGVYRGTSVSRLCPQNQAVSDISGKSGSYVDQLWIYCVPLVEPGHLNRQGGMVPAGYIGGTSGNPFGPFLCPDNKPGRGFTGKAEEWVDRVALVCAFPSVAAPVVKTLSLNSNSVVGGTTVNGTVTLNERSVACRIENEVGRAVAPYLRGRPAAVSPVRAGDVPRRFHYPARADRADPHHLRRTATGPRRSRAPLRHWQSTTTSGVPGSPLTRAYVIRGD